ncbi:MAG: hypothetical protein ACI8PZ_006459 [Myxococcota bacterium]|jgi:hypothetical protein
MPVDVDALVQDLESFGGTLVDPDGGLEGIDDDEDGVELELVVDDDWVEFRLPEPGMGLESTEPTLIRFADLKGNRIHENLAKLDRTLTPNAGTLRLLTPAGRLVPLRGQLSGRTLLIVHGTFSRSDTVMDALRTGDNGDDGLLARMQQVYDQVITFDYCTLSRQAPANAMQLTRLLAAHVPGHIDVISHSQGGLVTRFWLELLDPARLATTRSVFVAGTLGGTSLAAPPAIRGALTYLGNLSRVVAVGSGVVSLGIPGIGAVGQLFSILQVGTALLSGPPIVDAGVALVPGLQGMSRVGSNAEIVELRASMAAVPDGYYAVSGAFSPQKVGWKFWKSWMTRLANLGADRLFQGEHDLVVDTVSHTALSDTLVIPSDRVLKFEAGEQPVYHTNYFGHPRTRAHLKTCLGL